jgi:hypothetical protein
MHGITCLRPATMRAWHQADNTLLRNMLAELQSNTARPQARGNLRTESLGRTSSGAARVGTQCWQERGLGHSDWVQDAAVALQPAV